MEIKEAIEITGGLSYPSKMPGAGYSLPATACHKGSLLYKLTGSVCHNCYARKGRYLFGNVKKCMNKRLQSIKDPRWTQAMTLLISEEARKGNRYFRWHDSGDLQSLEHLGKIAQVAQDCPAVNFWLPTKESDLVEEYEAFYPVPGNLLIRHSAHMLDERITGSTVCKACVFTNKENAEKQTDLFICPAPQQEGRCEDCRACWSRTVKDVCYVKH